MNKRIIHMVRLFILFAGICVLGLRADHAQAAETVHIVRPASGDMEQLEAIEISEETAQQLQMAEQWQYAPAVSDPMAEEFVVWGSNYGYQDMGKRSNAEGRQYAYRQLEEKCREFTLSLADALVPAQFSSPYPVAFSIDLTAYALSNEEKAEIYFTFRNDNPQYFWLSNQVMWSNYSLFVLPYDEYAQGEARQEALQEILQTTKGVYRSAIEDSDSRYTKVKKIHDTLIKEIEYGEVGDGSMIAHSIAGAMTSSKKAVCEGYAKVMQLMMNSCGVSNIYVSGLGNGGGHAWNMVYMNDGKWYWLDATWDDGVIDELCERYFLVGNKNFTDHQADTPDGVGGDFLYALPAAADQDYDPANADVNVYVKGDINADGGVTMTDLMLCLYHVSERKLLTGDQIPAADINENGSVEMVDLMQILYFVSGRIESL